MFCIVTDLQVMLPVGVAVKCRCLNVVHMHLVIIPACTLHKFAQNFLTLFKVKVTQPYTTVRIVIIF